MKEQWWWKRKAKATRGKKREGKERRKETKKERRKKTIEKIKGRREDNKNKTKINTKHYNFATQRTKEHKKKEKRAPSPFYSQDLKV